MQVLNESDSPRVIELDLRVRPNGRGAKERTLGDLTLAAPLRLAPEVVLAKEGTDEVDLYRAGRLLSLDSGLLLLILPTLAE